MRILITGGAGFVGSRLARQYKETSPQIDVVVFDNLKRRGSELNLPLFKRLGIHFFHGDIRNSSDLFDLEGNFDLLIECSAEPSVVAGINQGPNYLMQTNLVGTLNCLEYARACCSGLIFLSTSRVYSIQPLRDLPLEETSTRLALSSAHATAGLSPRGIQESFPTHLPRSLYGATKLCSEQVIQEYCYAYKIKSVINRCGVLAGAGQLGKVDQGFFTLWLARHFYKKNLMYQGFGGTGKQVRDVLHPLDLFDLIQIQINELSSDCGIFNVGGGMDQSVSLKELTSLCSDLTGNSISIKNNPSTHPMDIPFYVTDFTKATKAFGWTPKRNISEIAKEIFDWISKEKESLAPILS